MPILVSLASGLSLPETICDYANPDSNQMQEEQLNGVTEIIQAVGNYESFIQNEIPDHSEEMIHYSNFRIKDIKELIADNNDCSFIRIYHARNEDGSQFTIAVPIVGNGGGRVKQTANVKYYVNCCACNPNCPTNHGF